ncbi:hypothetical protein VA596_13730 [Amycolatopsis sp., V23-08]|uniref:DUF4175 domain-containing protein n=1 Tax=Amycolatopsis heterodermiae TaxID=3110235 RepID=A0ABU5R361_9PSEU|nr:hypothetical protein [Amycolatopsis sp., V23-08]MEA5360603.1 hypothetical protein [Amycolatopsis sp., V23-08]
MTTTATARKTSLAVLVAAWAVPVFVAGQFALLAGVPVIVMLVGTLREPRLRAVRWWTAAITAVYAGSVAFWLLGPSDAPSLSKFLSPVATGVFTAVGVAAAVAHHIARRRSAK